MIAITSADACDRPDRTSARQTSDDLPLSGLPHYRIFVTQRKKRPWLKVRASPPPAFVRFREETFKMTIAADAAETDRPVSSRDFSPSGFDTMCLHAGYDPHGDENTYGLGQGAPRGVPLHLSLIHI